MLTAATAKQLVEDAIGENWTPGPPGRLDLPRFWHSFERRLGEHLATDPPDGLPCMLQVEGLLAMAGVILLCRAFWILQAKAIWHGSSPHPTWRGLLDWMRRSLDDLLRESRDLGADTKRNEQKAGTVPAAVVIPGPFADWRDPV